MNASKKSLVIALGLLASSSAMALTVTAVVTNTNAGQPISPGTIVVNQSLFTLGKATYTKSNGTINQTTGLTTYKEPGSYAYAINQQSHFGDPSSLVNKFGGTVIADESDIDNFKDILPGKQSDPVDLSDVNPGDTIAYTAMLGNSDDSFAGLQSWKVPAKAGTYIVPLYSYDAGTQGNTEHALYEEPNHPAPTDSPFRKNKTPEGHIGASPGITGAETLGSVWTLQDRFSSVVGIITFSVGN